MRVGRGWLPDSPCTRLLLSHPHKDALEWCEVGERKVRFLRLIPITPDEEQLLREHGPSELERRLEGADLLDPARRSVV